MKNMRKVLIALLVVMTLLASMSTVTAFAAKTTGDTTIYLAPNANWKKDGARFALYTWDGGDKWFNMTDPDGDGIYECVIPAGIENIIFCRMNPSATANNWNNKWNQTSNLKYNGSNNLYTVKEGTWDKGGGNWSTKDSTCAHVGGPAATCTTDQVCTKCGDVIVAATGHSYNASHNCTKCSVQASFTVAGADANNTASIFGTAWDTTNTANDMTYDAATDTYTKVYENVTAGTYKFKCARDYDWGTAYPSSDKSVSVATTGSRLTITLKGTTVNVKIEAPVAKIGTVNYMDLQSAINAAVDGDTITLLSNCSGDVTFVRAADVNVTIDGNNNTFNGTITIDGKSATYATGSLTIKNVKFDATDATKAACINFGGTNATRYITNVTIENCTFTGKDQKIAAIKSYTGGDKNITVTGCTVDNTMHSLLQVTNVTGLAIDNCTVNSKNGINLNNSSEVAISNCTVDVSGYAVRAGASSQGNSGAVALTNNTLKSAAVDEGVIVIRGLAQKNIDLVMAENVISGAIHVQGTTADTKVSAEANYWDGQKLPTVDGEAFYVKTYYPTDAKDETELSHLVATLNGVKYDSYTDVFADAVDGDEVIIVTPGVYRLLVSGKNITVTGGVAGVAFEGMGAYGMGGANVTFNNVTFIWGNADYKGLQHGGNIVYNNCTINGQVFLYGESNVFNNCTFNQTSAGAYNVWVYSSKKTEFNGCTIHSAGKAVLVYHEGGAFFNEVVVTNTIFNASAPVDGKAAIEIDTSLTAGASISIDAATVANGFGTGNVSGNSLWNNKKGNAEDKNNDIIITVGGETVLEPLPYYVTIGTTQYTSLQAAINKATNGATIVLSDNILLTETIVVDGKSITIDLNGKTISFAAPATFSARNANVLISVTGGASVTIDGDGMVLTNGAVIAVEDGSSLEIVTGTFDADVSAFVANGLRVVVAPQADGSVLYGVVSHNDTPYIGTNGNWWVGDYDTGVMAEPKVEIVEVDGVKYWFINGVNTGYIADPTDAITPEIKIEGNLWYIDLKDGNGFVSTGVVANAVDGIGIVKIEKLAKENSDPTAPDFNIDTYQITYTDGTTSLFYVANGNNGDQGETGNTGLKGQDGAKGDRGPAGVNGNSNGWLVNNALLISLVCVLLTVGVALVLNHKRLNWWSK